MAKVNITVELDLEDILLTEYWSTTLNEVVQAEFKHLLVPKVKEYLKEFDDKINEIVKQTITDALNKPLKMRVD